MDQIDFFQKIMYLIEIHETTSVQTNDYHYQIEVFTGNHIVALKK